jgi:hypothetical protein
MVESSDAMIPPEHSRHIITNRQQRAPSLRTTQTRRSVAVDLKGAKRDVRCLYRMPFGDKVTVAADARSGRSSAMKLPAANGQNGPSAVPERRGLTVG